MRLDSFRYELEVAGRWVGVGVLPRDDHGKDWNKSSTNPLLRQTPLNEDLNAERET